MNIYEGYEKGEQCNRNGCIGIIDEHDSDGGCSCHSNPPCSYCTDSRLFCPECNWDGREEQIEAESKPLSDSAYEFYKKMQDDADDRRKRVLDMMNGKIPIEKIDWISEGHTHFSMIKKGVFPKGMSVSELRQKIDGTFGGRFEQLNVEKGTFKFIAYTD